MEIEPHRRKNSLRLRGWDYSRQGAYFVTICTWQRREILSTISNGESFDSEIGQSVRNAWNDLPAQFPHVELDQFVLMPNHLHGILWIGTTPSTCSQPLGNCIAWLKYEAAKRCAKDIRQLGGQLWQRGYYDHIIRNDESLGRIRDYISANPVNWQDDPEYRRRRGG
ncbi:MAG: transposase [Chrysiogenetes bacterium]|nr:transposase [Chrysiogenetes bacterium]